uniref:Uncharacterized protein n=1 Tax=Anguilla anguilla TaxID=7936 RepID=A0A0E9XXD9_ANGAN
MSEFTESKWQQWPKHHSVKISLTTQLWHNLTTFSTTLTD